MEQYASSKSKVANLLQFAHFAMRGYEGEVMKVRLYSLHCIHFPGEFDWSKDIFKG